MNERTQGKSEPDPGGHVLDRIHACLDGELPKEEEAGVRAHCRNCADCGRAWTEAEDLVRLLEEDRDPGPLRPFWPEVGRRLERRRSASGAVRVGAPLAVAAGLLLGLFFPVGDGGTGSPTAEEEPWSDVGTSLSEAGGGGLADVYLLASVLEGENAP